MISFSCLSAFSQTDIKAGRGIYDWIGQNSTVGEVNELIYDFIV